MDTIKRAIDFRKEFIKKHPEYMVESREMLQLMVDEIEENGSEEHELDLFMESVKQLIEP